MNTYRLALLMGWYWEDQFVPVDDPLHQLLASASHAKMKDGSIRVSRFCRPDGTPVTYWDTNPLITVHPPLWRVLFWWLL